MRHFLTLAICGAITAPGVAAAQTLELPTAQPAQDTPPALVLAPLPTVAATEPAPEPAVAAPPPKAEVGASAPELAPPTTVAPVITAKEDKGGGLGGVVGTTAVGVAGGAAGAAVAGPVGKFAGGFIAKRLAQGIFGKKDETPELTVIEQTPSAVASGTTASDPAAAPTRKATLVADER